MKDTGEEAAQLKAKVLAHRGDPSTKKTIRKLAGFTKEQSQRILIYGKTLSTTEELWLPPTIFEVDLPPGPIPDTERFASDESYTQAVLWTIYKLVDKQDHSLLQSNKDFQHGVSTYCVSSKLFSLRFVD